MRRMRRAPIGRRPSGRLPRCAPGALRAGAHAQRAEGRPAADRSSGRAHAGGDYSSPALPSAQAPQTELDADAVFGPEDAAAKAALDAWAGGEAGALQEYLAAAATRASRGGGARPALLGGDGSAAGAVATERDANGAPEGAQRDVWGSEGGGAADAFLPGAEAWREDPGSGADAGDDWLDAGAQEQASGALVEAWVSSLQLRDGPEL